MPCAPFRPRWLAVASLLALLAAAPAARAQPPSVPPMFNNPVQSELDATTALVNPVPTPTILGGMLGGTPLTTYLNACAAVAGCIQVLFSPSLCFGTTTDRTAIDYTVPVIYVTINVGTQQGAVFAGYSERC